MKSGLRDYRLHRTTDNFGLRRCGRLYVSEFRLCLILLILLSWITNLWCSASRTNVWDDEEQGNVLSLLHSDLFAYRGVMPLFLTLLAYQSAYPIGSDVKEVCFTTRKPTCEDNYNSSEVVLILIIKNEISVEAGHSVTCRTCLTSCPRETPLNA